MTRYAHEEILFLGALRGLIYSYWAALVSRPGAALMGGGGLPPVGSFWYRDIKMTCLRRHCHASCVYTQAMLANLRCARLPPRRGDLVRFSLALAFFSRCSSVNTMGLFTLIPGFLGYCVFKCAAPVLFYEFNQSRVFWRYVWRSMPYPACFGFYMISAKVNADIEITAPKGT